MLPSLLEKFADDVLVDCAAVVAGHYRRGGRRGDVLSPVSDQVGRDQRGLVAFAEFGELLVQTEEQFELDGLFDGRYQCQLLKVHLQVAGALFSLRV